jgi:predicted AlkP superfamily phosphohydrolase/phosphomutase
MNVDSGSRLCVIGIDGATFDLMEPLLKEGRLPNITRLMTTGAHGPLCSTLPPVSPVAWTSFVTGTGPGKHGIFDFIVKKRGQYELRVMNSTHRSTSPVWCMLSEAGKRVGVLNVTSSFPPDPVNGFMISGLGSADVDTASEPPGLCREIQDELGPYVFANRVPWSSGPSAYIQGLHEEIDYRLTSALRLLDRYECDFLMVVFLALDGASHRLWQYRDPKHPLYSEAEASKYGNAIDELYEHIDGAIGQLLEGLGAGWNVMVGSDHGFGPAYRCVYLNKWLADSGYLQLKAAPRHGPLRSMLRLARRLARKLLPRPPLTEERRKRRRKKRVASATRCLDEVDFSRTKAFAVGSVGNVYLNIAERDAEGIVCEGEEAESLAEELINGLTSIQDPESGEHIVERVFRNRELFDGDRSPDGPDLLVILKKGYTTSTDLRWPRLSANASCVEDSVEWSGDHEMNGILILNGPDIKRDAELTGSDIVDVTPTALHLMGQEIPEEIDGKVLEDALGDGFRKDHPVRFRRGTELPGREDEEEYSESDAKVVEDRLRQLGYL